MRKRALIAVWLVFLAANVAAQSPKASGANPKADILAAFKKLKTVKKIRITSVADVNGLMKENGLLEYDAPDKYRRILKKARNGETFVDLETIQIAGRSYEKKGDAWFIEPKPFILLKDEVKTAVDPQFEGVLQLLGVKSKMTDARFVGEKNLSDKTFFVYKYRLESEVGTNLGTVWISASSGLPAKLETEALFGRNKVLVSVDYDPDATIVIERPKVAR